jgi:chemotaxis protein MotB
MRSSGRRASQDAGAWGGQLISLSDLMAGLLFVFIVIVLVFAYKLNKATEDRKLEVQELRNAIVVRTRILNDIKFSLVKGGMRPEDIIVDDNSGVLSLADQILFDTGKAELKERGLRDVDQLADVLSEILPRYAGPSGGLPESNSAHGDSTGRLEAVFVEGHTDNAPVAPGGKFKDNWDLSAARATEVFKKMMARQPKLDELLNADSQPLFSISGYADKRPAPDRGDTTSNETKMARNRRIDIRFIMAYPRDPDDPGRVAAEVRAANAKLASQPKR